MHTVELAFFLSELSASGLSRCKPAGWIVIAAVGVTASWLGLELIA